MTRPSPLPELQKRLVLQSEDAFWDMHDLLYETQGHVVGYSVEEFDSWVVDAAAELGWTQSNLKPIITVKRSLIMAEATWVDGQALGHPRDPIY